MPLNKNKVCFIYCTNNNVLLEESLKYVRALNIPEDIEVEVITIKDGKGLCEANNRAMKQSDAKYKVYLHQDVFIVNKNFIKDTLNVFKKYPKVGLLGLIGCKKMNPSGVWWRTDEIYGYALDTNNKQNKIKWVPGKRVYGDYECVQAVDGFLMMTQYDIPWREDVFKGWHMYDVSQCSEFMRQGYEVGVVKQSEPWCIHDCGVVSLLNYEDERLKFVNEYRLNDQDHLFGLL